MWIDINRRPIPRGYYIIKHIAYQEGMERDVYLTTAYWNGQYDWNKEMTNARYRFSATFEHIEIAENFFKKLDV